MYFSLVNQTKKSEEVTQQSFDAGACDVRLVTQTMTSMDLSRAMSPFFAPLTKEKIRGQRFFYNLTDRYFFVYDLSR